MQVMTGGDTGGGAGTGAAALRVEAGEVTVRGASLSVFVRLVVDMLGAGDCAACSSACLRVRAGVVADERLLVALPGPWLRVARLRSTAPPRPLPPPIAGRYSSSSEASESEESGEATKPLATRGPGRYSLFPAEDRLA